MNTVVNYCDNMVVYLTITYLLYGVIQNIMVLHKTLQWQ